MSDTSSIVRFREQQLLTAVKGWLAARPKDEPVLGVSRGYIARLMERYGLSIDDVNTLAAARLYRASFVKIGKLLAKGFTPVEIVALYEIRDAVQQIFEKSVSLASIALFTRTFASSGLGEEDGLDGEDLSLMIHGAVCAVRDIAPWLHYPDDAIGYLCKAAEHFDVADVEAAIDAVEGSVRLETRRIRS